MVLGALRAGVREVLWLRDAERTVTAYGEARLEAIRREKAIAYARMRTSRSLANPFTALLLLTDALAHARVAARLAEREVDESAETEPTSFWEAETCRDRVEARTAATLRAVESRTPIALSALRIGRVLALGLLVFSLGYSFVRSRYLVHNVALHKPVMTSALRLPSDPAGITDGRTRGTYAIQTIEGKSPFVMIDLEREYRVERVRVFNRGDGWFDESLPLTLETSYDGVRFHEVARRTEHFDVWTVDLGGADARFIRITKDTGYIALNEIEVYARE